jgi:hypothetical protein
MGMTVGRKDVFVPTASLLVFLYCLVTGRNLYCVYAGRFLRRSRRVHVFSTAATPDYYAKHGAYEKAIVDRCAPAGPAEAFALQQYVADSLIYLIPYHVLSETVSLTLIAPPRLESPLFPADTRYVRSLRDVVTRIRKMRSFSRLYLAVKDDSAELSYVAFEGADGHPVAFPLDALLVRSDRDFYELAFAAMVRTLEGLPALRQINSIRTRRWRDTVEYVENVAFGYCERSGKAAIGGQERAIIDFAIEYSLSYYHEFRYWDEESRAIHQTLCHQNHVARPVVPGRPGVSIMPGRCARDVDARGKVLAFPAQVETNGFSNAAHSDVHLASAFVSFLRSLRDAGYTVTVKVKDPEDAVYFADFPCLSSERGNYLDLVPEYDLFVSCGYTTPGIDLKLRGLRSYYFYPEGPGNRLYPSMTVSGSEEFLSLTVRR